VFYNKFDNLQTIWIQDEVMQIMRPRLRSRLFDTQILFQVIFFMMAIIDVISERE